MDNVAARQDIIHPSVYYTTKTHIRICQIITSSRYTSKLYDYLFDISGMAEISQKACENLLDSYNGAYKWEINQAYNLIFQIGWHTILRNRSIK